MCKIPRFVDKDPQTVDSLNHREELNGALSPPEVCLLSLHGWDPSQGHTDADMSCKGT